MKVDKVEEPQLGYSSDLVYVRIDAKPFVKWAGGKRKLLSLYAPFFPPVGKVNRYFEPFLGGGAVFFYLQHPYSFLSDRNKEVVELFQIVRDDVEVLIEALRKHRNEEEYYYNVRKQRPVELSSVERSARFLFLNKTCYNGLYRVNSMGQFNVPFGKYKNPVICDVEGLRAANLALQNTQIAVSDFEVAVSDAQRGDFIYMDPPYHPRSKTSSFTAYTAGGFGTHEQERLARIYRELDHRGCYAMLSNSDTPLIRELYADFQIVEIQASRAVTQMGVERSLSC